MKAPAPLVLVLALSAFACGGGGDAPPPAQVELHAVPSIVDQCDGELSSWSVAIRGSSDPASTAACGDVIVVGGLEPYKPYTLEITGYSGQQPCWTGACDVTPFVGNNRPSCTAIQHTCASR